MSMNLNPNKHERMSFKTNKASLGFIGPPLKF